MSRKITEPRMNIWIKRSNVKRLRKYALLQDETNDSILGRIIDRLEKTGDLR